MAYVAMNNNLKYIVELNDFLNGVCRHERIALEGVQYSDFLNGVCRHEQ